MSKKVKRCDCRLPDLVFGPDHAVLSADNFIGRLGRLDSAVARARKTRILRVIFHACPGDDLVQALKRSLSKIRRVEIYIAFESALKAKEREMQLAFLREFPDLHSLVLAAGDFSSIEEIGALSILWNLEIDGPKRNAFSLAPLRSLVSLEQLALRGQTRDCEALSELRQLKRIDLIDATEGVLRCVPRDAEVEMLKLEGGDYRSLATLRGRKVRELWLVGLRSLADLGPVVEIEGLHTLGLDRLPSVKRLPNLGRAKQLRILSMERLSQLRDLSPIRKVKCLHDLKVIDMDHLSLESLKFIPETKRVRMFDVFCSSKRRQAEVDKSMRTGYLGDDGYIGD